MKLNLFKTSARSSQWIEDAKGLLSYDNGWIEYRINKGKQTVLISASDKLSKVPADYNFNFKISVDGEPVSGNAKAGVPFEVFAPAENVRLRISWNNDYSKEVNGVKYDSTLIITSVDVSPSDSVIAAGFSPIVKWLLAAAAVVWLVKKFAK